MEYDIASLRDRLLAAARREAGESEGPLTEEQQVELEYRKGLRALERVVSTNGLARPLDRGFATSAQTVMLTQVNLGQAVSQPQSHVPAALKAAKRSLVKKLTGRK